MFVIIYLSMGGLLTLLYLLCFLEGICVTPAFTLLMWGFYALSHIYKTPHVQRAVALVK